MSAARLAAVLLAAGASRRYGRAKQLEPFEGSSLVRGAALAALEVTRDLRVVISDRGEQIRAELTDLPLRFIDSPDWSRGMGHSIAAAFRELRDETAAPGAALLCLVDQPLVRAPQLRRLIDAGDDQIVIADYGTRRGPPVLFPSWSYAELAALGGDQGARPVVQRHADRVVAVAMPEAACDVDTEAELRRLIAARAQR